MIKSCHYYQIGEKNDFNEVMLMKMTKSRIWKVKENESLDNQGTSSKYKYAKYYKYDKYDRCHKCDKYYKYYKCDKKYDK